jgi:hypothetical protein
MYENKAVKTTYDKIVYTQNALNKTETTYEKPLKATVIKKKDIPIPKKEEVKPAPPPKPPVYEDPLEVEAKRYTVSMGELSQLMLELSLQFFNPLSHDRMRELFDISKLKATD